MNRQIPYWTKWAIVILTVLCLLQGCVKDPLPEGFAKPSISTVKSSVSYNTATLTCTISRTNYKECGFYYGTKNDLSDKRAVKASQGNDKKSAEAVLSNLELGKTYYYQAYVNGGHGIVTSGIYSFTTILPVTNVTLSQTSLTLNINQSVTLTATVSPSNATDKTVTWTSSDTSVATVSNGTVTGKAGGTATINAKAGDKTATCKVTVQVPATSVILNHSSFTLNVNESFTLTATVYPSNATDKTVTWTSSDTSVATVSNGTVTGKAGGTATITAKAGDKTATCKVTVQVPATGVSLNYTSLTLNVNQSFTLTATVSPSNATDKTVTWTSSDTSVATVSNGTVTGKSGGTATITAKAGDKTATCKVTVQVPATGVSLNYSSFTLNVNESFTLTATVYPSNATDKTVTWTSSDTSVATVSNGKVTGKSGGTATITAKAGDKTATCKVTVQVPATGVSLNYTSLTLNVNQSFTLTATVSPSNATDKTVTWTSSDTSVATVSNGTVTGRAGGTAVITAKAGDKTATCKVTVQVPVTSVSLNYTYYSLTVNESFTLAATVYPSNATDKTVTWTSSNTSIATVSNGTVVAKSAGTAIITAKAGNISASCTVIVLGQPIELVAVDLGLSVKWANINIGANSPEEYGDYYAWGEITTKSDYSWTTYKWCNGTYNSLTMYNTNSSYGIVDNKTRLDLWDDVAWFRWGGWRMPTKEECDELRKKCTWTWTSLGGKNGYRVTGPNGNSIFLPAAGGRNGTSVYNAGSRGYYWSSSLNTAGPFGAWYVDFDSSGIGKDYGSDRCNGFSVRPVTE